MISRSAMVYSHGFERTTSIYRFLESVHPYGIALLRRIQHERRSTDKSILLATFPPERVPERGDPFVIFFFDPVTYRATDGWFFTSLEIPATSVEFNKLGVLSDLSWPDEQSGRVSEQLVAILQYARRHWDAFDHLGQIIKVGETHGRTTQVLESLHFVLHEAGRPGGPYEKHLFASELCRPTTSKLPDGLEFDEIRDGDYDFIVEKSHFVDLTFLRGLTHAAARETETGRVAAWAFIGTDGGMRTVHVEPQWRGKRVASAIIESLMHRDVMKSQQIPGHDEHEQRLQHVNIAADNSVSLKLFKSFGATYAWDTYWLAIDLARVP